MGTGASAGRASGCEARTCRGPPGAAGAAPRCNAAPRCPARVLLPERPGFMEPAPPARPFPPSTGQLSASCKDTAQLNVQTPNRKRGGDPVVTPCAHEMPAVAEHRATRPGSYEPAGTGHRAGTVAPCEVKHSVIM